jgi:hypothetical protein
MSETEAWFIRELMNQIIKDYQTPKISTEVSISSVLSIFLEDIINHQEIKGSIFNASNSQGYFKLYSKEFPFKKPNNNQSDNIDFLFSSDNTLLLVELKTCNKSFSPTQKTSYIELADKITRNGDNAAFLIDDLVAISEASEQELKYKWVYKFLEDEYLKSVEKTKFHNIDDVKIVYIGPERIRNRLGLNGSVSLISFNQLSQIELAESTYGADKSKAWNTTKEYLLEIEKLDKQYYK